MQGEDFYLIVPTKLKVQVTLGLFQFGSKSVFLKEKLY